MFFNGSSIYLVLYIRNTAMWYEKRHEMTISTREGGISVVVSIFDHPELLFQELVNFMSSFRVLLKGVFL
jgi:hypothetical protein